MKVSFVCIGGGGGGWTTASLMRSPPKPSSSSPANTGPNDHLPLLSLSLSSLWKKPLPLSVQVGTLNVFETTIRYVGGLLTAYSFTGDPMFRLCFLFNLFFVYSRHLRSFVPVLKLHAITNLALRFSEISSEFMRHFVLSFVKTMVLSCQQWPNRTKSATSFEPYVHPWGCRKISSPSRYRAMTVCSQNYGGVHRNGSHP